MDEAPVKMFVGIRVPIDIATSLGDFRDTHFHTLQGLRWTDTDDLHITLKYLGPETASSAKVIAEELANISQSPVDITLSGGGVFEDVGVLFISIVPALVLMQLQTAVDEVALAHGVPPSQHPYTPHISIGRINEALIAPTSLKTNFHQMSVQLDEFCQRLPRHHFRSTEMSLFQSVSGHYEVLRSFQL